MSKVRVGSEGGQLIKHWPRHRRLHTWLRSVVSRLEKVADIWVLHMAQQSRAKRCGGEERGDFQQRELVVREHVEGVAEEFFRSGTEGIQVPAVFQDSGKFRNLNEARLVGFGLKHVEPNGVIGISGLNHDQLGTEILPSPVLLRSNELKQGRRGIAMMIGREEPTP